MIQTEQESNGSLQFRLVRSHGPRSVTFVQGLNVLSLHVGRIRMIGHVLLQPHVILKHLWSRVVNTKEFIQGDTATVKLLPSFHLSLGRHRGAVSSKVDCVRQCTQLYLCGCGPQCPMSGVKTMSLRFQHDLD